MSISQDHQDDWTAKVALGRTGLSVSRLGFGSSYPAPSRSYLEAFERGVNYFYWGSRRRDRMGDAIRTLAPRHRDELVIVIQSYSRFGWMLERSLESALRKLNIDYADALLLGWHNDAPARRIIDAADELVSRGLVRHVALSSHNRRLFSTLLDDRRYGIWHLRYNAVHRGAEREVFPTIAARAPEARPGVVAYTPTRWGHLCDPKRTPSGEPTPTGTDCLRFVLSSGHVDTVISGPSSDEHVRQAMLALERGPMSDDELAWMRRIGDHIYGQDVTTTVRDRL
jgi:aryl-alcohol dehydrogenase-like predicted oxidoreductase